LISGRNGHPQAPVDLEVYDGIVEMVMRDAAGLASAPRIAAHHDDFSRR